MNLEAGINHLLGLLEVAIPELQHDSFEEHLPLLLHHTLRLVHDLPGPNRLALHLEELSILKQCKGYLLLGYFRKASLDQIPRLCNVSHFILASGGYEPDLPLKVVRAR